MATEWIWKQRKSEGVVGGRLGRSKLDVTAALTLTSGESTDTPWTRRFHLTTEPLLSTTGVLSILRFLQSELKLVLHS